MFPTEREKITVWVLICLLNLTLAWLPPERCRQKQKLFASSSGGGDAHSSRDDGAHSVLTTNNITEIAHQQTRSLLEKYGDAEFFGVPVRGSLTVRAVYKAYVPNSCTFHTYDPKVISSVYCSEGVACKLGRSVSTTSSYTASEGYNWGVKISTKLSLFAKVFEIGGEVSTGGTYSCAYTSSGTTSDNVECSIPSGGGKTLRLYSIRSDMRCQFSEVRMHSDTRNGEFYMDLPPGSNLFTDEEMSNIMDNALIRGHPNLLAINEDFLPDLDKMPDGLLEKLKRTFPDYNPFTDMIEICDSHLDPPETNPSVFYFKPGEITTGIKKVIPFSNEHGDSVYQYACVASN